MNSDVICNTSISSQNQLERYFISELRIPQHYIFTPNGPFNSLDQSISSSWDLVSFYNYHVLSQFLYLMQIV